MAPKQVKAAVMLGPHRMETQYFPYPELHDDNAMILKMEMSGICGTDKHTYDGRAKQYAGTPAETDTPFPIIPGHENVGIVAEIGKNAAKHMEYNGNELKPGDRVTMSPDLVCGECWYCRHTFGYPWCDHIKAYGNAFSTTEKPSLFGGWAEYMYIKPGTFVYKVPDDVPPEVAVFTEVFTVSYALDRAKEGYALCNQGFSPADTVVVQGVGPMGLSNVIKARIEGAGTIVAIDKSQFRLDLAAEMGADILLNVNDTTAEERIAKIREITGGRRGADVVVEATGSPHSVVEGLEFTRKGGCYIEAGNFVDCGSTEININRLMCSKNIRLFGVTNHPFTHYGQSLKLFEKYAKWIPFHKIVTHRFKIDDAEQGLIRSTQPDTMKVVIEP